MAFKHYFLSFIGLNIIKYLQSLQYNGGIFCFEFMKNLSDYFILAYNEYNIIVSFTVMINLIISKQSPILYIDE